MAGWLPSRHYKWLVLGLLLLNCGACRDREQEVHVAASVREERVQPPVPTPPPTLLATQGAFTEVARKVTPSVVNISTSRLAATREIDPFFRDFFGDFFPQQPRQQEQSLGSGFIISQDGYILTNEHVVKGAQEIKVRLSDQRVYPGRLIGIDPRTDIAVLKIDAKESLTPAVLGNSEQLQVGAWALAIGNPFGLDRTVTVGVISATGRTNVGIEDYEDFIQTDASINPGNSGGPLLNIYGEVIGINTAIVASGQGIGFAIPINLAKLISRQLIEKGDVTRGWLGVSIQPLTPELAETFGLSRPTGALVNQVLAGSPAERAGVRRGDLLLTFNGKEVRGVGELQLLVASTPVGQQVPLEILRNGRKSTLQVKIVAQERERGTATGSAGRATGLGLTVIPSEEQEGVVVAEVDPHSNAAAAGVQSGDLLLAVNHNAVNSPTEFASQVRKQRNKSILLLLKRGDTTLYLAFSADR